MLTPSQVKPFILHEDKYIANAVLQYFARSFNSDNDLMPLVIQRFLSDSDMDINEAAHFSQTEETLRSLFDLLKNNTIHGNQRFHISAIIANSDVSFLAKFSDRFVDMSQIHRTKIEQRFRLASLPIANLWDELNQVLKTAYGKTIDQFDFQLGELIIKELGKRPEIQIEPVLIELNKEYPEDHWGYEQYFYAMLAGELRLEKAVGRLITFLSDEFLSEVVPEALIKIGSKTIIDEIEQRFQNENWDFRLVAGRVLSEIKLPESERAIIHLLAKEDDIIIKTILADGLGNLFSKDGIPLVKKLIEDDYDTFTLNLEESLYVNCKVNDVDLPQLETYKKEMDAREQIYSERLKEFELIGSRNYFQKPNISSTKNRFGLPKMEPIVNTNKVGRNEPCSCGSGKKFKKCCGR